MGLLLRSAAGELLIGDAGVDGVLVHVDVDNIAVPQQADLAAGRRFGGHMADGRAPGRTGESAVGDEGNILVQSHTGQCRGGHQHFTHAWATLGTLVQDDHDVAFPDLTAEDGLHRRLLALEHTGGAAMYPHLRRHGAALHNTAIAGDITKQERQAAGGGIGLVQGADDLGIAVVRVGDILPHGIACDGRQFRVQQPHVRQFLHDGGHAAGLVQFLHEVFARRCQMAQVGSFLADFIEHGGYDSSYIRSYVEEKQEAVREMKNKLDELKAQESMKETYPEWESEYMHAYGEYQYVLKEAAACLEYSQKLANADNIYSVYGMKAWIISDRNYEQLIGESARLREFIIFIVSIIVVVIITVENIMLEQKTGMEYILNSSAYGRKKRWLRKYLAMVIFTGCFTLITCIIQFMIIKSLYGMPYINAPVLSLSFIYEKIGKGIYKINIFKNLLINLNIRQYIFIHYAKWIVISYVVMNVSILVSALWMHKRK